MVAADGSSARNLSNGEGRKQKIAFRVQRLISPGEDDEEEDIRYLDPKKALTLRGVSEETRASGFFRGSFQGAPLRRLLWGDAAYQVRGQAQKADVLLLAASRFDQFPDLHVTDVSFATPRRVTPATSSASPLPGARPS